MMDLTGLRFVRWLPLAAAWVAVRRLPARWASPVTTSVQQRAGAQAAGLPAPAPVVNVTVPPAPRAPVQVVLDGRVIAESVECHQETKRLRVERSGRE